MRTRSQNERSALILLAAGAWLFYPPPVRADGEARKVKKVIVTTTDHKEPTKKLDLTKAEDRAELNLLLTEGRVEEFREDKPPAILDLRWDLGLWTIVVFLLLFFVLRKLAWGPMLEGLKKREESIRLAVDARSSGEPNRRSKRAAGSVSLGIGCASPRQLILVV